jgi:hypothetical protein
VLLDRNAVMVGKAYTQLKITTSTSAAELAITALWGWSAVPVPVKDATLLQGQRFAARRDAPFGVAGSPTDGSEVRLLARVDPDVEVMLGDYRRESWAA